MHKAAGADSAAGLVGEVFACSPDIARQIVAQASFNEHKANTTLIHQGDEARHVFMMIAGLARAFLSSEQGMLVFIEEYGRGDIFGDLQLTQRTAQESEVVAATPVGLVQFDGRVLAGFAERHGSIGLALARILFARLQRSTLRIFERTALSAAGRVYSELLRLGEASDNILSPPPVVSDLALRVGTTRETASRCLGMLIRRGIVERGETELRIVAPGRLEELVF